MAQESKIKWKLEIDGVDNASKAFKNVTDAANKQNLSLLNATAIYGAASLAISQITSVLKDVTGEFLKADAANVRLSNTLKATGQYSKETVNGLDEYAAKMQRILGVQDEVIKDTLSFNMTLGVTADQAKQMTSASAALAKALGMDLNTANQQLSATLSGQTGRLSRFIPQLKQLTQAQLEQGEAINIVNEQFNKYLKNTNSVSELTAQLNIGIGDIKESIGKGFMGGKDQIESLQKTVALIRSIDSSGTAENIGKTFRSVANATVEMFKAFYNGINVLFEMSFGNIQRMYYDAMAKYYEIKDKFIPSNENKNNAEIYNQKSLQSQLGFQELLSNMTPDKLPEALVKIYDNSKELAKSSSSITTEYEKQLEILKKQENITTKKITTKKTELNPFDVSSMKTIVDTVAGGASAIISKTVEQIFKSENAKMFQEFFSGLVDDSAKTLKQLGEMLPAMGQVALTIINILNKSKEEMTNFVDGIINTILELPQRIVDNVPLIIERILQKLPEIFQKMLPVLFTGAIQIVINSLTVVMKELPNLLGKFLGIPFWVGIAQNMLSALGDAFKNFFQSLFFGSGGSSISSIIEKGGSLFNPAKDAGKELFKIKDYAEGEVAQTFEDRVNTVTTAGSKGLIQSLIDGMADVGRAIWDGLRNGLASAWNWFKDIGNQIWQGIKDGLASVGNFFGGGGGFFSSIGDSIAGVFGWAEGGLVQGNAPFQGNSYGNDTIPALLSAGEYVVSRDEMRTGDFSKLAEASGHSIGGNTNISLTINVAGGSSLTESQLRSNVVPAIVSELRKLSQNGQQIVSKKGIY